MNVGAVIDDFNNVASCGTANRHTEMSVHLQRICIYCVVHLSENLHVTPFITLLKAAITGGGNLMVDSLLP